MTAVRRLLLLPAALILCAVGVPDATAARRSASCNTSPPFSAPIADAATRFQLPATLIRAVIAVESNGVAGAVSPKGAVGLMQIMPTTWANLRARYGLGLDPFDPCDNILAGTAYLRELLDRYGDPGFLVAYNAGPRRYESYISGARPLPAETIAYVARISNRSALGDGRLPASAAFDPDAWRVADLFVRPHRSASRIVADVASPDAPGTNEPPALRASALPIDTIFVARTGIPK